MSTLLVVGLIALEVSMRFAGQSAVREVFGLMERPARVEQPPVDVGDARRKLTSGDARAVRETAKALRQDPDAGRQLVDELVAALGRAAPPEQRLLVAVLSSLKKDAARAAPALAKLARDPDPAMRIAAVRAVCAVAEHPAPLLPPGREIVRGMEQPYNYEGLRDLRALDPEVVESLLRGLAEESTRHAMCWVLRSNYFVLGPRLPDFAAWWVTQVGHSGTPDERLEKVRFGPRLGPTVAPWLAGFLDDPEPYVRLCAALGRLSLGRSSVGLDLAREEHIVADYLPVWASGEPPATGTLSRQEGERATAEDFLQHLHTVTGRSLPGLGSLMGRRFRVAGDSERRNLVYALEFVSRMRDALPQVLEALEADSRKDKVADWVFEAATACAGLGPDGDAVIPYLVRALESEKNRSWAPGLARRLAEFGPRAAAALPRLRLLASSTDWRESTSAEQAIAAIEGRRI